MMRDYDKDIMFDDLRDESYLRFPKLVATITLCGNMTIRITDDMLRHTSDKEALNSV